MTVDQLRSPTWTCLQIPLNFLLVCWFFTFSLPPSLPPSSLSLSSSHPLTHSLTPLLRCDPAVRPIHHPATLPRTELLFLWCVTSRKQIHFSGHQFIIPNGESHLSCGGQPHFSPSCKHVCVRACTCWLPLPVYIHAVLCAAGVMLGGSGMQDEWRSHAY